MEKLNSETDVLEKAKIADKIKELKVGINL